MAKEPHRRLLAGNSFLAVKIVAQPNHFFPSLRQIQKIVVNRPTEAKLRILKRWHNARGKRQLCKQKEHKLQGESRVSFCFVQGAIACKYMVLEVRDHEFPRTRYWIGGRPIIVYCSGGTNRTPLINSSYVLAYHKVCVKLRSNLSREFSLQ